MLYITRYDHKGIVGLTGFDVAKYPSHSLALLFLLQRSDRSDWGRSAHPALSTECSRMLPNDTLPVFVDGKEFLLDVSNSRPPVHKTLAIGGQATCVRRCILKNKPGYRLVFKSGWKEKTRRSERSIIAHIKTKLPPDSPYHGSLPTFVASEVYDEISTDKTRQSLGIKSSGRELVMVMMVELDGTITQLGSDEVWDVLWECLECRSPPRPARASQPPIEF